MILRGVYIAPRTVDLRSKSWISIAASLLARQVVVPSQLLAPLSRPRRVRDLQRQAGRLWHAGRAQETLALRLRQGSRGHLHRSPSTQNQNLFTGTRRSAGCRLCDRWRSHPPVVAAMLWLPAVRFTCEMANTWDPQVKDCESAGDWDDLHTGSPLRQDAGRERRATSLAG